MITVTSALSEYAGDIHDPYGVGPAASLLPPPHPSSNHALSLQPAPASLELRRSRLQQIGPKFKINTDMLRGQV